MSARDGGARTLSRKQLRKLDVRWAEREKRRRDALEQVHGAAARGEQPAILRGANRQEYALVDCLQLPLGLASMLCMMSEWRENTSP
jgi:hypothetical protein